MCGIARRVAAGLSCRVFVGEALQEAGSEVVGSANTVLDGPSLRGAGLGDISSGVGRIVTESGSVSQGVDGLIWHSCVVPLGVAAYCGTAVRVAGAEIGRASCRERV